VSAPSTGPARRRRPFALVTHSYYEEDPRVRRQAESIAAAGREVDVYALRRPGDEPRGTIAGVRVRRFDVQRHQGAGIGTYLLEYVAFFVRVALALVAAQPRRRYALVQVATLPDWLVLAALPLRLAGVPVVLDLHEAMPEFFRSRFPAAANPVVHRGLELAERISIAAATHAITVNDGLRDRLLARGVGPGRIDVVPNSPSLARFDAAAHPTRAFMADGTLRLVYAGALTPTYELDVLVDAIGWLRADRPGLPLRLDLYGRGDARPALEAQVARLGLGDAVTFHGRIPIEDVPAAIAAADIGIAPTRRDRFTDVSLSTKIFEYSAMGLAVVASALPLVERTFPAGTISTYQPGDAVGLGRAIAALVDDPASRDASIGRARDLVIARSWEEAAPRYLALLDRLAGAR
jgi:glycosyltransferase involved in cell wall biosynthesis